MTAMMLATRLHSPSGLLISDQTIRNHIGEVGLRFRTTYSTPTRTFQRAGGCRAASQPRRRHSLHGVSGSNFSGQISSKGPVYKKLQPVSVTPMTLSHSSFSTPPPVSSPWSDALASFNHNHSFEHNYENKLSKIKMNCRAMLDQLSFDSPTPNPWGTVKIIDFAHAFFNEEEERDIDENFRHGVDSFVEIFECFLSETDDQIM